MRIVQRAMAGAAMMLLFHAGSPDEADWAFPRTMVSSGDVGGAESTTADDSVRVQSPASSATSAGLSLPPDASRTSWLTRSASTRGSCPIFAPVTRNCRPRPWTG